MRSDLTPHIDALRNTVDAASLNYDIWWVYKSRDHRPEYVDTMNQYLSFFSTSIHAHFVAMIVALYRLYETRANTFNVKRLLSLVEEEQLIKPEELAYAKALASEAKPLWVKVSALRNEAFGHLSNTLSEAEVFKKAGVSPNQLKALIDLSKRLLNTVSIAFDGTEYAFNLSGTQATLSLLQDLKAHNAG